MTVRRIAISLSVVVLFAVAGVIWLISRDDLTDADVVFCLSDSQRGNLADAAVNLGLAGEAQVSEFVTVDGRAIGVNDWRMQRSEDFERACEAIRPAGSSALTPLQTGLLATFNVVVGGLLGFGSANLVQRFARARQNGRSLRGTVTTFLAAVRAYAREWDGPVQPSDVAVQDRRAELLSELRVIRSEYPGSPAGAAIDTLSTRLSGQVFRQWQPQHGRDVETSTEELETEVSELAHMIEHPWRNRAKLRGASA